MFSNGFEQVVVKKTITLTSQKDGLYGNQIGANDIGSFSSLPILTALISQVFIR